MGADMLLFGETWLAELDEDVCDSDDTLLLLEDHQLVKSGSDDIKLADDEAIELELELPTLSTDPEETDIDMLVPDADVLDVDGRPAA